MSFIPLARPEIGADEVRELTAAAQSGWLSTGPRVRRFEDELRQVTGARSVIALSSCTAGLHLGLLGAGVGPGDEVITSAITFVSAVNVIQHCGARPVLCDVEPDTLNPCPESIRRLIGSRTRAIVVVHLAGLPCDLREIRALAEENGVALIEDAAHALGARHEGRPIGEASDFAAFSFHAVKNLTTGEGGALAVADEATEALLRRLSLHGLSRDGWTRYERKGSFRYDVVEAGFKCNMTDLQAALGLAQLRRFPAMQARRRELVRAYDECFDGLPALRRPRVAPDRESADHLYVVRVDPRHSRLDRDALVEAMKEAGVGSSVHFIPIHRFTAHADIARDGSLSGCEEVADQIVSLPLWGGMSDEELDTVVDVVTRLTSGVSARAQQRTVEESTLQALVDRAELGLPLERLGLGVDPGPRRLLDSADALVVERRDGRAVGVAALADKPWDSERAGAAVGQVSLLAAAEAGDRERLLVRVRRAARERGHRHLYWRAPFTGAVDELADACAIGFVPVDVLLTFAKRVEADARESCLRALAEEEVDDVAAMAADCFAVSRFHADSLFASQASDLHAAWLRNSWHTDLADEVLVLEERGRPVAFVTLARWSSPADSVASIGLVGVDPARQGQGLGKRLLDELDCFAASAGIRGLVVGTQGWNLPAVNLYTSQGYRTLACSRTLKMDLDHA